VIYLCFVLIFRCDFFFLLFISVVPLSIMCPRVIIRTVHAIFFLSRESIHFTTLTIADENMCSIFTPMSFARVLMYVEWSTPYLIRAVSLTSRW